MRRRAAWGRRPAPFAALAAAEGLDLCCFPALAHDRRDGGAPARPTALSADVSHDAVTLTWDDPQDESISGYIILRRDRAIHPEGSTGVATLSATDGDTDPGELTWSKTGGADGAAFTLSSGGVLAFAAANDYETPDDADGDRSYEVTVPASTPLVVRDEGPPTAGSDDDGAATN